MAGRGTAENRYVFEFEGVSAIAASEVTGVAMEHSPVELYVGNRPNPVLLRGTYKASDVVVRHAHALNEAGTEIFDWMAAYLRGDDITPRSGRLIVLDEDGRSPVATYELINCVPKRFEVDGHNASGNNASYFRFTIQPEEIELIT